jgi:hypothetical protein
MMVQVFYPYLLIMLVILCQFTLSSPVKSKNERPFDLNKLPIPTSDSEPESSLGHTSLINDSVSAPSNNTPVPQDPSKGKNILQPPAPVKGKLDQRIDKFLAKHGLIEDDGTSSTSTNAAATPNLDWEAREQLFSIRKVISNKISRLKGPQFEQERNNLLAARKKLPNMNNRPRRANPQAKKERRKQLDKERAEQRKTNKALGVVTVPNKRGGSKRWDDTGVPDNIRRKREQDRLRRERKAAMKLDGVATAAGPDATDRL